MLIGYVSDERYVALADAHLEFISSEGSVEAKSRATGSVHLDLPPGEYQVCLQKPGYGSKRVTIRLPEDCPHHFRLLADGLLGYVWPKWVKAGERGEFRVHAVEAYELQLWKYGWTKTCVRQLGWHDEHGPRATMQITPDGDYSQTGVGWNKQGYHIKVHSQFIQAPAQTGLYYFHARTAGGLEFAFPWIVAPAQPQAAMAVLASNITWNAYNRFGGRSNYILTEGLPPAPTLNARQDLVRYTDPQHVQYDRQEYPPLSFDRPEPFNDIRLAERIDEPIRGRNGCHLAPAEWRLLGWLERKGFPYDLYAETQLNDGTLRLDDYRVLVLNTHPEYWTRGMYQAVLDWVTLRGGKLVYLGGNGLNCEVTFTDPRTMIVNNGDSRDVTARGLDSRMHLTYASEASLLGVCYSDPGAMTGAPYQVIDPDHWAFQNTGLKAGDIFGRKSLHERCPGGASGHETDKVTPQSPKNVRVIAKGLNQDNGGAQIIYYDTPSGGEVFSVGSITWPACLPVDADVSSITANVLQRFLGPR